GPGRGKPALCPERRRAGTAEGHVVRAGPRARRRPGWLARHRPPARAAASVTRHGRCGAAGDRWRPGRRDARVGRGTAARLVVRHRTGSRRAATRRHRPPRGLMRDAARRIADGPSGRAEAVRVLAAGGLVAIPTDTVYGIAVALTTPGGVERLFAAKSRPPDKAIALLLADVGQAREIGELSPAAEALGRAFWP